MESSEQEVLQLFEKGGALLKGHFVLRSGLHSGHFFQCAQSLSGYGCGYPYGGTALEKVLDYEFGNGGCSAIGLVIGQEIARQTGKALTPWKWNKEDLALEVLGCMEKVLNH